MDALTMLKAQSDEPFDLVYHQQVVIPAADVAQYGDASYQLDKETSERWLYFTGRYLSTDPLSSSFFGDLLQATTVAPSSTTQMFVRLVTPTQGSIGSQTIYCGVLNALNDEVLECKVMLHSLIVIPSSVSTRLAVQAMFPGQDIATQNTPRLAIGPSGAVTGLSDSFGTMSARPMVSSYSTVTVMGVAFPYNRANLLVVTANLISSDPALAGTAIRLQILHATPTRLVLRFDPPAARAGSYALQVSLTHMIPLDAGLELLFTYSGKGAGTYLTGLRGANSAASAPEVIFTVPSTNKAPQMVYIDGANLDKVMGDISSVRLTSKVDTVVSHELCHLDRLVSTPATLACYVSPFARGRYALEVLVGIHEVPLPSQDTTLYVYIQAASQVDTLPPYSTSFTFDTVLLVGASYHVEVADSLQHTWAADADNVGLIVSATPCYSPNIIGSSVPIARNGTLVGFTLTANSSCQGVAHVCLKNGATKCGKDHTTVFYTRVSIDIITVDARLGGDLTRTPSAVNMPLRLISSAAGDFVNNVFAYVSLIPAGSSCVSSVAASSSAQASWERPEQDSPYLTAEVQVASAPSASSGSPIACLALSTNVNDAFLRADRYIPFKALDCLAGSCGGQAGVCAGGACRCNQWFGGHGCANSCESSLNGQTCNGHPCLVDGSCDCSSARSIDEHGIVYELRGPSCQVAAQRVTLAAPVEGQVEFESAPTYYASSDYAEGTHRGSPIILLLEGPGIKATKQNNALVLDIVVIVPEGITYVSVRLHYNDSRLLQPIGSAHQLVARLPADAPTRHYVPLTLPIRMPTREVYLVIEAARSEATPTQWSHANIALSLRSSKSSFASFHSLATQGVLLSDVTSIVTLNRGDSSTFIEILSNLGRLVALTLGLAIGLIALRRRKLLAARGPQTLVRGIKDKIFGEDKWFRNGDQEMGDI
eukprot:GILJ01016075.1.p1 GENE.GILJ01016075.1~~GILJ01016075.1.p1  ORF type:complete len:1030 (+),score=79.27 GILJ01016075.1:281-3091(+)